MTLFFPVFRQIHSMKFRCWNTGFTRKQSSFRFLIYINKISGTDVVMKM